MKRLVFIYESTDPAREEQDATTWGELVIDVSRGEQAEVRLESIEDESVMDREARLRHAGF